MKLPNELTKRYYSIGEVSEMLEVAPSLIRHWEATFKDLHTRRDQRGSRKFTPDDIQYLAKIYDLVKVRGFTLEGAKKELKKKSPASKVENDQLKLKLLSIKKGLQQIIKDLE